MKIISCHVENFGKLHNYTVTFSDGISNICEENGWGKSTFAAFVRAMFYGLDGERKRSIEENERKRYMPWQGGVFGGQLVFEADGKEYQISRIFHDKEANDEFELRDAKTNLISKDYSKKIGEEIFKIDRESFMRTIFISQSGCETASTGDINAKIGNLTDNTSDLNNFDAAHAKLTEIINGLNPGRVSGSLSKRRDEIARYDRIVQDGKGISDSMDTYQGYLHAEEEKYDELKSRIKEIGEQQTEVSKLQSVIAKKSEWERLKKNVSIKKEEADACRVKFPGDVPKQDDVKRKISECVDMDKAAERMRLYQVSESEEKEFAGLSGIFANELPKEGEMNEKIAEAGKFRTLSQECSAEQMSTAERERLAELEPYFLYDLESAITFAEKWSNRNTKKATLSANQAALTALKASMAAQKPQKAKMILPVVIVGVLLALAGLAVAVAASMMVGCIITIVGIILLLAGLFVKKKDTEQMGQETSPEYEKLARIVEEDTAFIRKTDAEVTEYLRSHGRNFDESNATAALQEIAIEEMEYASLKKKVQRAETSTKASEMEKLRQSINSFLCKYGVVPDDSRFSDDLYTLKNKVDKYITLVSKKENFKEAQSEFRTFNKDICDFITQCGYVPAGNLSIQLNDIREITDDYKNLVKAFKDATEELERFEAETEVSMLKETQTEENLPSLEELNQTMLRLTDDMEKVHNAIMGYNKTLEDLQEKYDEWEESRLKLDELKILQAEEQKKYDYVFKARVKLVLAKEALTAKYADPILEGFCTYFEMISGDVADKFHIDANTTVTVDELGRQRETNALSSGYRDLIGICLRLALVDAMYREERPVLIMDDPFTNLDDGKINAGINFLKKNAEKYQIIYFTCSNARNCRENYKFN